MNVTPAPCARCGQPHLTRYGTPACAGHKKLEDGTERPCGNPPRKGATVCNHHGGKAPQVRAAANRRAAAQAAEAALHRGLAAAYGDQVPDIDPAEAMLRAVSWKYAEVLALRGKVAELDDADRVWGRTREKSGGEDYGTTEEAKPNIWWQMLRTAETQLVQFAKDARAAGCDERRVQLATQQGQIVAALLQRILDGLYAALLTAGITADVLAAALWQAAIADVVPRELHAAALEGTFA